MENNMHSKIDLYREYHSDPTNHYSGNSLKMHFQSIHNLIKEKNCKTALDYGCGGASSYIDDRIHLKWGLEDMGLYDPAVSQFGALPGTEYDLVICTDVLEHVPEEEIPDTLSQIFGLSKLCSFINIAMYPASTTLSNGENAHCTLKSIDWWRSKMSDSLTSNIEVHALYSFDHSLDKIHYETYKKE